MEVDEIHALLKGAGRKKGADFDITLKWFQKCGIVDDKLISYDLYVTSYERLAPNREELSLSQLVVLFAIFTRESHKKLEVFTEKFSTVKSEILEEIQENWRKWEAEKNKGLYSSSGEEDEDVGGRTLHFTR